MNALIRKEVRLLLPAWIGAMILAVAPALTRVFGNGFYGLTVPPVLGTILLAPLLGMILLALASFGQEFSSGTFSLLLAQPVPRQRLWRVKTVVLAVALALVWTVSVLCIRSMATNGRVDIDNEYPAQLAVGYGLLAAVAFAGGLWTTLLLRQVSAAFWFTALIPAIIFAVGAKLLENSSTQMQQWGFVVAFLAYSLVGVLWARRLFLRAQDTQWTGGVISVPAWWSPRIRRQSASWVPQQKPLRALLRKEFQSHQVSLLIAGTMVLLHLVVIVVRKMGYDPVHPEAAFIRSLGFWWLLWMALPPLIGSAAIAEERKHGTLESLLCLPMRPALKLAVKLAVALFLGVLVGGVAPWTLESTSAWMGIHDSAFENYTFSSQPLVALGMSAAGLTLLSFYASSLSRNTLQAIGAATVIGLALGVLVLGAGYAAQLPNYTARRFPLWSLPLLTWIGVPTLLAVLTWLTHRNYRSLQVGPAIWIRNLFAVLLSLAFIGTATALTYNRAWELLLPLEPRHGPARLTGSIRPRLCFTGDRVLVLLPDGRVWASKGHRLLDTGKSEYLRQKGRSLVQKIFTDVPTDGSFLEASNWLDLAGAFGQAAGIQSDGTLWKVCSSTNFPIRLQDSTRTTLLPKPERVGAESDWRRVVAGGGFFLALKSDGTLWGWGNNQYGQLGPDTNAIHREPVRIGSDADWITVFAANFTSIGVKRDGSMWKWGFVSSPPGHPKGWKPFPHPEPVRWHFAGTNWLAFDDNYNSDLAVQADGTLWAAGMFPAQLFGHNFSSAENSQHGPDYFIASTPRRIGNSSDWSDVIGYSHRLAALKKNGELLQHNSEVGSSFWRRNPWKPSRYSDWIAIGDNSEALVALAADGSLSYWYNPMNEWRTGGGPLRPSRRPLWTLNILPEAK